MAIPWVFATESGSVSASQLDDNFAYVLANTVSVASANIFTAVQTMLGAPFDESKGATIASAASINLETMTGNYGIISGTAIITAVTLNSGAARRIRATGAWTINNNAVIKVQGGSNYTATVGDLFYVWGDDAGVTYWTVFAISGAPSTTITVPQGGTGITSGTSGGLPYFNSTTSIASSALLTQHAIVLGGGAGAAPNPLGSLGTTTTVLHGNAAGDPSYSAIALAADVSGILPVANGGTGQGSSTGTGAVVLANTPTLITPVLGAATGTSVSVSAGLTGRSATATPAAASAVAALTFGSAGIQLLWGTGSPDTVITAPKGSLYIQTDGTTTATRMYVNKDASTGWASLTASS